MAKAEAHLALSRLDDPRRQGARERTRTGNPEATARRAAHAALEKKAGDVVLIDLRKQDIGATTVVSDQPKSSYFVASLMSKDVPTVLEFTTVYKNTDAVVTTKSAIGGGDNNQNAGTPALPASLLARIRGLPGVAQASGGIADTAGLVGRNGKVISRGGAPGLA